MLEKNKDYVEFTLQCTSVEYGKNKKDKDVCFNGYSDFDFPGVPMDVVCKEFDHKVIMVSKRNFERLQAENEQLKKKLEEFSPVPGYREFLTALYPGGDVEKLVWATEQLCCGRDLRHALQVDLEYYRTLASAQAKSVYSWKEATGCSTPEEAKERIKALNERIDESEADYNHLLCTTGFESEGEIEDALDKCDHSTLRKALVDYEFDYEELLKLTGYKSNQDIRVALNYSEQFVYETMRELINSLKRQAKYTNLNWQNSTGFITPEKCGEYIKKLEDKLHRINGISKED